MDRHVDAGPPFLCERPLLWTSWGAGGKGLSGGSPPAPFHRWQRAPLPEKTARLPPSSPQAGCASPTRMYFAAMVWSIGTLTGVGSNLFGPSDDNLPEQLVVSESVSQSYAVTKKRKENMHPTPCLPSETIVAQSYTVGCTLLTTYRLHCTLLTATYILLHSSLPSPMAVLFVHSLAHSKHIVIT